VLVCQAVSVWHVITNISLLYNMDNYKIIIIIKINDIKYKICKLMLKVCNGSEK